MTWRDIHGWFDFQDIYDDAVSAAPASGAQFVEVGSWLGRSTVYLAHAIQLSGKSITLHAVDTWEGSESDITGPLAANMNAGSTSLFARFLANLDQCHVRDAVQVLRCPSLDAAKRFALNSLDFVFIDADHTYDAVASDLAAWVPIVKPGGVIAGHDISFPGVLRAVRDAFGSDYERAGSSWRAVRGEK